MITKVSSLIMINYKNIGLDKLFNEDTLPILEYFLKKDIDVLIGKDEYENKTGMPSDTGLSFKPYDDMLLVSCDNIEYLIGLEDSVFFIIDRVNQNNKALFSFDEENKTYANIICIEDENQSIREVQKIFLDDSYSYEYQKTIATADGTIKFPLYKLELLKELDEIDYLKLTSYDKNYNGRLINTVEVPKIDDNLLVYFENIFSILETSTIDRKRRILSIL